jgi:HSP20 family protein
LPIILQTNLSVAQEKEMAEEVSVEKVDKEVPAKEVTRDRSGPLSALPRFEQELERFFGDHHWPFRHSDWPFLRSEVNVQAPSVDVVDREEEIIVRAELPGFKKENINVSLNETSVTIKATSESEKKVEEGDYHRREISRGYVSRTVQLPSEVVGDEAKARLTDGVLEIKVPKATKSKSKTIEIES